MPLSEYQIFLASRRHSRGVRGTARMLGLPVTYVAKIIIKYKKIYGIR